MRVTDEQLWVQGEPFMYRDLDDVTSPDCKTAHALLSVCNDHPMDEALAGERTPEAAEALVDGLGACRRSR